MPSESQAGNYSQVGSDAALARMTLDVARRLRATSCRQKRRYYTRADATAGAKRDRRRGNRTLNAYECQFCEAALSTTYWHRGHLGNLTRGQHGAIQARAVEILRLAGEL